MLDLSQAVTLGNLGPAFDPSQGALASDEPESAAGSSIGEIVQFQVAACGPAPTASVTDGAPLTPDFIDLSRAMSDHVRQLGLFEPMDGFGRPMPELGLAAPGMDIDGNALPFGPLPLDAPTTKVVRLGDTEIWRIADFTDDAHPIHLHQVQFQLLARIEGTFADEADEGRAPEPDRVPDGGAWSLGDALPIAPEGYRTAGQRLGRDTPVHRDPRPCRPAGRVCLALPHPLARG